MRASQYIIAFVGALILSCTNFTDIQPTHSLTPNNAFKTMSDLELHLNGIYSGFQSAGYFALAYGTLPDMMSDNLAENVESLGNYRSTVDWLYVANDGTISGVWATPYNMINDCNILLSNVDNFKETKTGQRNRLKSQALAIRALAHFDLLRYFGQNYDRNSGDLGVPVKTVSNLDKPSRNTVKEVYDQVYADLAQARSLMGSMDQAINTSTDRSRIDIIGVDAIQARVAYYAKDYATAINSATSAINSQLGLADRADFASIWANDAIANEVIWSIAFLPGDGYVGGDVFFAVNNRVSFKPSQNLLLIYNQSTDIRYSSYFSSTTSLRPGELIVSKYLGRNGASDGLVNWKVLRMGEMYLIRAEAQARSGLNTAARADLKALRNSRISTADTEDLSDPTKLLTAIMVERRKELFLEGHRWFDLRMAGVGIVRGGDCKAPATVCSLPANSYRFVWPIPQDEIKAKANISVQQNSGY
jgi:hypothetical protein